MQRLAEATEERGGVPTQIAYLDHDVPSVADVLSAPVVTDGPIDALGLFLADGYHARVDIPKALADAAERVSIADHGTLGMGPWLFPALARALSDVDCDVQDPGVGVALVAAGSARPEARDGVVHLACAWQRERGGPVRPAFAAGPGPTLEEALDMLSDTGCAHRAVALLMLAPGVLADRVFAAAAPRQLTVAHPLGSAPEVIDRIICLTTPG